MLNKNSFYLNDYCVHSYTSIHFFFPQKLLHVNMSINILHTLLSLKMIDYLAQIDLPFLR